MKNLNEKNLNEVSGGARGTFKKTYEFRCKKCGHTWKQVTANPGDIHGCPKCGWWFESRSGNRDENGNLKFDRECIEYESTIRPGIPRTWGGK